MLRLFVLATLQVNLRTHRKALACKGKIKTLDFGKMLNEIIQNNYCKAPWVVSGSSVLKALFMLLSDEMICKLQMAIGISIEPKKSTLFTTDTRKTEKKKVVNCISMYFSRRVNKAQVSNMADN